jgi:hypothetical protein
MKQHKAQFQDDLILWRKAVLKWAKDVGLGIGALVRSKNIVYCILTRKVTFLRWDW